ncbi:MAG TPA: ribosome recycling factor [Candidatus Binatia bacterium]|nr:ribosome recycling factor [Candidatus Binatia bacterium]
MSQPTLPDIVKQSKAAMDKAMENTRREFSAIRTGKATTQLLDLVKVEAYGNPMPLNQVASVSAPEPRLLTVTPWDKSLIGAVEKAIRDSDLGLNPASQGGIIRVPIPPLTEERRRDLVKVVHKMAEEGRVAVRHARHEAMAAAKKLEHVPEDDRKHAEKDVQKVTDDHIRHIDELVKAKEAEIMEV